EQQADRPERERGRQPLADQLHRRDPGLPVRVAEVTVQQAAEVVEVLRGIRPVEAEPDVERVDLRAGGVVGQQLRRGAPAEPAEPSSLIGFRHVAAVLYTEGVEMGTLILTPADCEMLFRPAALVGCLEQAHRELAIGGATQPLPTPMRAGADAGDPTAPAQVL